LARELKEARWYRQETMSRPWNLYESLEQPKRLASAVGTMIDMMGGGTLFMIYASLIANSTMELEGVFVLILFTVLSHSSSSFTPLCLHGVASLTYLFPFLYIHRRVPYTLF
jgi:hypothetical protein